MEKTTKKELAKGYTRHTLAIKEEHLKLIQALANYSNDTMGGILTNLIEKGLTHIDDKDIKKAISLYADKKKTESKKLFN